MPPTHRTTNMAEKKADISEGESQVEAVEVVAAGEPTVVPELVDLSTVPEPVRVIDLTPATSAPETALDGEGKRYMTGRLLHYNTAGDEVPAPTQALVQKF